MDEEKPTFEQKIKAFVDSLETAEAEQFIEILDAPPIIKEVYVEKPVTEVADMTTKTTPTELKRSYIIESLPGNKMRIIEDYGTQN